MASDRGRREGQTMTVLPLLDGVTLTLIAFVPALDDEPAGIPVLW
jgi:hypothetical protein